MDLLSYKLGKNAGGGGGGADLSEYFNTEITATPTTTENIGNNVIKRIPKLTIADGITSLKNAFYQNTFKNISFEEIDCSNIKDMSNMFFANQYNTRLTSIDLKNIKNTNNKVNNVAYLFSTNSKLETIENMFPLSNTVQINNAFQNCPLLKKIDLSNWNITANGMDYLFSNDTKLAVIDISNLTHGGSQSYVFSNCGTSCLQSDGAYADGIPYVYVKDATEQNWVLTGNNGHPSTWSTNNVIIKSN